MCQEFDEFLMKPPNAQSGLAAACLPASHRARLPELRALALLRLLLGISPRGW